jgi:rhodanese-related sulfurtransferase
MNKKIYFSTATIITTFIVTTFIFCGCSQAIAGTEGEVIDNSSKINEDISVDELTESKEGEEIEEVESSAEEKPAEVMPISVERVHEIIENGEDYIILDVRNQDEYDNGHIEGAVLIPVSELEGRLDELPADKPIITYCKSGARSATASSLLVENGFREVYDMGGISEWIDKGCPVVIGE